MKKAAKFLSVAFALSLALSAFAGCGGGGGGGGDDDPPDYTKTQIKISNYQGGYGRVWLDNAKARFEKMYENYEFEPGSGKKGVQLHIDSSINGTAGMNFAQGVSGSDKHIFFTEDVFYYDLTGMGNAADITDIVTEPLTEYNETETIADKMDTNVRTFFNQGTDTAPLYRALPHYFSYRTLYYDIDLFDLFGLWRIEDSSFTFMGQDPQYGRTKTKADYTLSGGIDGPKGTAFDGLPATYDELFELMDYMKSVGVTPIHTYGSGSAMNMLYLSSWVNNEGRDSYMQTMNPTGTSDTIVKYSGDTPVVDNQDNPTLEAAGTAVNGTNVQRQLGKYRALQLAKRMAQGTTATPKYFHTNSFSRSENNIQAQGTYIFSAPENEPIAFYMDGIWWENEAAESLWFDQCEALYGQGRYDRNFGLLPVPFADEATMIARDYTWTINSNCNLTLTFINNNITDPNILNTAKMFVRFLHTDEEMQNFSVQTSTLKPFNYTVPAEKMTNMTTFGKKILELTNDSNVDILYTFTKNAHYLQNFEYYYPGIYGWGERDLTRNFFDKPAMTAADLFKTVNKERNDSYPA